MSRPAAIAVAIPVVFDGDDELERPKSDSLTNSVQFVPHEILYGRKPAFIVATNALKSTVVD